MAEILEAARILGVVFAYTYGPDWNMGEYAGESWSEIVATIAGSASLEEDALDDCQDAFWHGFESVG